MRRQIVIMLLGLMTILSLSAFANVESRENDHATQPYKYIGKELDRTHGLDWYDHGARHYDPVTGRWNVMDALAEKYYPWSPYVSCGDDPVNAVDPDGKDYWSTSDPLKIIEFFNNVGSNSYYFDFSDWHHATDNEIIGNLVYNDKTKKAYTSYATIEHGEIVITGKQFDVDLLPVSFSGEAYPGAFFFKPFSTLTCFFNSLQPYTYTINSIDYTIDSDGRIGRPAPILCIVDNPGSRKASVRGKVRMGKIRGKAPRDHERQNEQVRSLAQKYKLTEVQQEKVHREISGQGYSYKEIEELIIEMFYE